MNYKIDTKSNIPAYIQLYQYFRDDIVQGVYPYKSKLPPKRTTCAETNLSLITVEHSYDLLIQEGYVESKERSGYYVIFKPNTGFASYSSPEHLHKNFLDGQKSTNEQSFPFSAISKSMRKVITDLEENIDALNDIERSIRYFNENYTKNINIDKYAKSLHVSTCWFNRRFKQVTKVTPLQYILSLRLSNAKMLLETNDYNVTEAAYTVGFNNPLYFSRLFTKHIGMSPSEYKALHSGE